MSRPPNPSPPERPGTESAAPAGPEARPPTRPEPMDPFLAARYQRLLDVLRAGGPAVVAFSGGVDSAFLLKACADALGPGVRAVLGVSASLSREAEQRARDVAARIGVPLESVESGEMTRPEYVANGPDRCFHCKDALFQKLEGVRDDQNMSRVLDGTNAADLNDDRPGIEAAHRRGVRSPLAEEGWTKEEIRRASRALGLPTWDIPASPCLSSRIPHGTPVTVEALTRIEQAERLLHGLGFREVRVRHHGPVARIEVPAEDLPRILEMRERVVAGVSAAGYTLVTLDLAGYRSGGADPQRRTRDDAPAAGEGVPPGGPGGLPGRRQASDGTV